MDLEQIEALERLAKLKRQGLLTDAEFEREKNRILSADRHLPRKQVLRKGRLTKDPRQWPCSGGLPLPRKQVLRKSPDRGTHAGCEPTRSAPPYRKLDDQILDSEKSPVPEVRLASTGH